VVLAPPPPRHRSEDSSAGSIRSAKQCSRPLAVFDVRRAGMPRACKDASAVLDGEADELPANMVLTVEAGGRR
jgi:hypothetical protein